MPAGTRARQLLFPPSLSKHCVCFVDRKNYRLQDIQLSKINPGEISPRGTHGCRGALSPGPPCSLTRGAPTPHAVRSPQVQSQTWTRKLSRPACRPKPRRQPRSAKAGPPWLAHARGPKAHADRSPPNPPTWLDLANFLAPVRLASLLKEPRARRADPVFRIRIRIQEGWLASQSLPHRRRR
jgi:hypothetical protein